MKRIYRRRVDSSNMISVGYDPVEKVMEIEYPSRDVYRYFDVPASEYEGFMRADSKGTYLNQRFKPAGYKYKRIASSAA